MVEAAETMVEPKEMRPWGWEEIDVANQVIIRSLTGVMHRKENFPLGRLLGSAMEAFNLSRDEAVHEFGEGEGSEEQEIALFNGLSGLSDQRLGDVFGQLIGLSDSPDAQTLTEMTRTMIGEVRSLTAAQDVLGSHVMSGLDLLAENATHYLRPAPPMAA